MKKRKLYFQRAIFGGALVLGVFLASLGPVTPTVSAATGVNQQINFQGRLLNSAGATVPDGTYNLEFKIYQDGDGQSVGDTTGSPAGTLKWTEDYLNTSGRGVNVKNGYLSVQLGSVNPFGASVNWNQDNLWLSMNIGSTNVSCTPFSSCSADGEMTPMKRMSSNVYSFNSGLLNGLSGSQYVQLAQGVQADASSSTSLFLNKTGTGNIVDLQSTGADAFIITNTGDVTYGANANHTLSVATAAAGIAGKTLSVTAGAGGTGNANGGSLTLTGGAGTGTGYQGLVNIGATAFTAGVNASCAANCTITQSYVDANGTIIINSTTAGITITLPAPSNTAAVGRILYLTTASGSTDFNLSTNGSPNTVIVAMRQNTTATMIWNGSAWTPGGASNATTLQATYANGSNPSTTPEIKLDSTRGTIDIQDADTTIGADLLAVHSSNALGLGTVLFGVGNNGRVTIQDTSDQNSSFRVLNSNGDYLLNVNSSNNYVLSNAVRTPGNEIANPGFETGGAITSGEEGWFGSAQASIVNDNTNAHGGNYELQVTPNATNLDVYAGSYSEVRPGDSLYLEGYAKNSAGATGDAGVQITWYDQNKSIVSYSTSYSGAPGTSYVLRSVNATVPAGAYYAKVSATVRSNASSGTYYFDDLYLKRSVETAPVSFRNTVNTTAAFQIQSATSSQTLFTADTTNNVLKVGDSTGTDTATTLLVLDSTTANPTTNLASKNGGLFYRSDNNTLKAIIAGTVVDICTTAITCSGYSASASSTIQLQSSSPGAAQTGNFNITGTGILSQLQTQDAASGATSNLVVRSGNAASGNSGNLTLDVGTASSTTGSISIGHAGVATTIGGTLSIQGSNSLSLGTSSSATGSILLSTSAGANTITIRAPGSNPTASWNFTLPQNPGNAGDCLKDSGGNGTLTFNSCSAGTTTNLQNVYDNSTSPATVTLADSKDLKFVAQDTVTDPNVLINLQCVLSCGSNGRFAVQNGGTDVLTVAPNSGGITLNAKTQIGSSTTDSTEVDLQLDSSNLAIGSEATCTTTNNQGSMYYNTTTGSIRACVNGSWGDLSNPDTLGLLSFGIIPSSGSNPYDLPSQVTPGASGPCKVSWASNNSVTVQACTAYSGGRRVNITSTTLSTNSATTNNANLTTTATWGHVCLTGANSQPAFTSTAGQTTATAGMPTFSITAPILCLADVLGSATTAGKIANIYDVRTFTSSLKEAVTASTAAQLGMMTDSSGTNGSMVPSAANSSKLYGLVVATDGSTSTTAPNMIVTTVGPSYVKATAGTAGQFIIAGGTAGYASTTTAIPNNSFYYSAGNTRGTFSNTCTAASNCSGSLYVNFIVR
jgi:hypothetical protein